MSVIFFMCSLIVLGQQDSSACLSFKKGAYSYKNDEGQLVYIKRTFRAQQETNTATRTVTRYRIKWLSACTYEITQTWSNRKTLRKKNGAGTVVHITSTAKYSYEFSCACKGSTATTLKGIVYRRNAGL